MVRNLMWFIYGRKCYREVEYIY